MQASEDQQQWPEDRTVTPSREGGRQPEVHVSHSAEKCSALRVVMGSQVCIYVMKLTKLHTLNTITFCIFVYQLFLH